MVSSLKKFARFTSIAVIVGGSFASAFECGFWGQESFADGKKIGCSSGSNDPQNRFFTLSGSVGSFTKAGFNSQAINRASGAYPTESFTSVFGELNTKFNLNVFMNKEMFSKFEIGLGVAAAGLAWDSTKNDNGGANGGSLGNGSGLNNNYIGGYDDFTYAKNRQIMLQNAYIDLQAKNYNFKAGRYESDMAYYSGYTQGFNVDYHFGYGDTKVHTGNEIKLWWFSSFGRAFAYSQWFLDYYFVKTTGNVSYGIHSFGADINYGGITKTDDGYLYGDLLLVRPFMYFYPGLYEAPGMQATYEYQFGNGLGFKVIGQGFALHVHKGFTTASNVANKRYDETVDEWSGTLNLIAQGNIYNYNVRVGYYENFGSGNSHFGTYGNPMGFDFWTASVYDIGASISDVINRNARTGYLSGGGVYSLKYGDLSWDLLGRITRSPRSDEESIALNIKHTFKNISIKGLSIGLKLEWFRDTTKAGYNPGASLPANGTNNGTLKANRTDDRSHAFFTIDYVF